MSAEELDLGSRFLAALAAAAASGDREPVYAFLASDVEWEIPQRALRGVDEVRAGLSWVKPPDNLDVEFERGDLRDLGGGRYVVDVRETYLVRQTHEVAYVRKRRIDLMIRDGTISRYEMRVVG